MSQGLWNRNISTWERVVLFGKVVTVICAFWAFAISMRQKELDRFSTIKPLYEIKASTNINSFSLINHGGPVYFNGYEAKDAGMLLTETPRRYSTLIKDQRAEFQFSHKLSNDDIMVSYWTDIDLNKYKLEIKWKEDGKEEGFYIARPPLAYRSRSYVTMPSHWLDSIISFLVPKDWFFSGEVPPEDKQLTVGAAVLP